MDPRDSDAEEEEEEEEEEHEFLESEDEEEIKLSDNYEGLRRGKQSLSLDNGWVPFWNLKAAFREFVQNW